MDFTKNTDPMDLNDDLLILYLLGETSPEETAEVEAWRMRSAAHELKFEQFKAIWDTGRGLRYDGILDPQASLQRLKDKAAARSSGQVKVVRLSSRNSWLRIAAAIVLLAGCSLFWVYHRAMTAVRFATNDQVRADTLSDGSVVTLNKASIITYPRQFSGQKRDVILEKGEAFFKVTHNKAMPFIISAGTTEIRVVGTSFNVKKKDQAVEVIVETGIVQVTRKGNTVVLHPGEKVLVRQNSAALRKEKNPDQLYNYYRSKEFIANNTPLWRMVEVLNEAYGSHIIIARPALNDLPLNTTFKDESLDNILVVIARTFRLTIERKQGKIIIN
jgi:transmembrane sensor